MAAPSEVTRLVDRFDEHIDEYKSGRYNETQVRVRVTDFFPDAKTLSVRITGEYELAYQIRLQAKQDEARFTFPAGRGVPN